MKACSMSVCFRQCANLLILVSRIVRFRDWNKPTCGLNSRVSWLNKGKTKERSDIRWVNNLRIKMKPKLNKKLFLKQKRRIFMMPSQAQSLLKICYLFEGDGGLLIKRFKHLQIGSRNTSAKFLISLPSRNPNNKKNNQEFSIQKYPNSNPNMMIHSKIQKKVNRLMDKLFQSKDSLIKIQLMGNLLMVNLLMGNPQKVSLNRARIQIQTNNNKI